ncbi:hypothetical protein CJA_2503 [Cellvibrio japonicus Ueda107]|uniref:Uncharacterized protein n=1 Tax=Cellvibrio japonicus (strain Ueda107) TaxID=498211 RepID=B3PKZ0_CELJU|nr:hypothetical protein CJA_2503 [Cellvibrio japonicus Ueda107]
MYSHLRDIELLHVDIQVIQHYQNQNPCKSTFPLHLLLYIDSQKIFS